MIGEMIDFPCSPTFSRGYAEQGLTADYPEGFEDYYMGRVGASQQGRIDAQVNLYDDLKDIEERIRNLEGALLSSWAIPREWLITKVRRAEVNELRGRFKYLQHKVEELSSLKRKWYVKYE